MADETVTGGAEEAQPESVRDSINAAIEQVQTGQDDAGAGGAPPQRDASGRFIRAGAEGGDQTGAQQDQAQARQGQQQPGAQDQQQQTGAAPTAPEHWNAADKATFAKIPPEGQALLLDINKRMVASHTRAMQGIAAFQKDYAPVAEIIAPHMDALRAAGHTPASYVKAWTDVEMALVKGGNDALDVFERAVKAYKVDPQALIARLTGGQGGGQQQQQQGAYVDPEIVALRSELAALKNGLGEVTGTLTSQQRAAAEAAQTATLGAIDSFASEKTADGKPAHPYFDEVIETMIRLGQADLVAGQKLSHADLQRLYDQAIWVTPTVRDRVLADQRQADVAKQREQDRQKAQAARTAGSSVSGAPSSGGAATTPKTFGTVREALQDALEQHRGAA